MNRALFFDRIRQSLFDGRMSASQVAGTEALLAALDGWPVRHMAYGLATAYHEVGRTMQPIKEKGGNAYFKRMYDITGERPALAKANGNTTPGDGAKYPGRGYPQLTWKNNYRKASKVTGVDLVADPDRAMELELASLIMRDGMEKGWYTGKKLSDYLNSTTTDYINARRVINGTDKAKLIADYAAHFETALRHAGYGKPETPPVAPKPILAPVAPPKPITAKPAIPTPLPWWKRLFSKG